MFQILIDDLLFICLDPIVIIVNIKTNKYRIMTILELIGWIIDEKARRNESQSKR
jgi:hypothetical protein